MAPFLMALGVFVVGAVVVFGAYLLLAGIPQWMVQRKIQRRMDDVALTFKPEAVEATLVKGQIRGLLPALDRLTQGTSAGSWLARLIDQSGAKVGVSTVLLGALGLGIAAAFALAAVLREPVAMIPGFGLGAAIPFIVLMRKRTVRIRRFEEQFPEALDTLSRAIKAGHAFTTAMGMVADEGQDPIGPEFRKTFDEQNFGLPLKDALNNLAIRVGLLDVRFFDGRADSARDGRQPLGDSREPRVRRARALQDPAPGARLHGARSDDGLRAAGAAGRAGRRAQIHQPGTHGPAVHRTHGAPHALRRRGDADHWVLVDPQNRVD